MTGIIVADKVAPIISLNLRIDTIAVNESWIDKGVTVTDNYGETIVATISGAVNTNSPSIYEITYTVTDSIGNTNFITMYATVIE